MQNKFALKNFAKFFAFKFLIVAIYVVYFVNLFNNIKVALLILLEYKFFVNNTSIIKSIIIV